MQAITELQATVGRLWSDTTVDIFGSNYTRLALPISDVDCVLVSKTFSSETPQTVLRTVAAAVKSEHWASRVELLESAKIPVLKIVFADDNQHQVMLDVTCGHSTGHSGLSARDVIYSYQAQMPALRPLVLLLKAHAQSQGLNCSYTGGMSSYALVLLAIRFLQACGDEHHKTFEICRASSGGGWKRRFSADDASLQACERPSISSEAPARRPQWIYTFSREGNVIWRTGIGNLLLLFLETYITFDYRRFGISVKNGGEYFPLPIDRVVFEPGCVVTPFITDPIKPGRSIGNCFRMHERSHPRKFPR
ncbi:TPA: hypothetical protein N0F65_008645 [Lagenidium giganteum]|uniref:Poly(A) RNA polymerase mitochondrial-like central palm domain-containing protein n=1 Tax=Lagenidium giganteum TaxID=4803 RepID=A0AAV2Z800_9STRA|nr:TPA: hypothetical protein N0F65_008645 [Lagenidium giganteum]